MKKRYEVIKIDDINNVEADILINTLYDEKEARKYFNDAREDIITYYTGEKRRNYTYILQEVFLDEQSEPFDRETLDSFTW